MSGINAVSGYTDYTSYGKIASGSRLQSAADGAAELAISEKESAQVNGLNKGSDNAASGIDMLNVADGGLSNITDYLQSIRELAVQSQNTALYTSSDIDDMKAQADQYLQGISDIADQTTFNTKNILNGSDSVFNIAADSNGNSMQVTTGNATLQALGLDGLDISDASSIDTIDNVLGQISSMRSSVGAQTNALYDTVAYNDYSAYNHTSAVSRMQDLDIPQAVSEQKKNQLLNTYSIMMQKKKQEDQETQAQRMFS